MKQQGGVIHLYQMISNLVTQQANDIKINIHLS